MSLRGHTEQVEYENWVYAVADACEAENLKPPCDWAYRWSVGQSVEDILCELRLTPNAKRYAA